MTYNKEIVKSSWKQVYCNLNGDETAENIVKAITNFIYVGKFNKDEHLCAGCTKLKNDDNLFILINDNGAKCIWQVGSKVEDMTGCIVPHLYKVREIGILFD